MAEPCVHLLVAEHARLQPDRVALVADGLSLSYRELNEQANRLAARLLAGGVRHGEPVGLLLPRSASFVIAALGVLKAGAAYLPLDPRHPSERLQLMLSLAGSPMLLSTTEFRGRVPDSVAVSCLDEDRAGSADCADDPEVPVHPDDLAYTMFTSGSTGVPKAVMIPHRGVVGLLHGEGMVPVGSDDVVLHVASVSFDAAAFDIWTALLNGARLVVATRTPLSTLDISALIRAHGVTVALLPAGMFHLMVDEHLDELRRLRCVMAGGDVLSSRHAHRFAQAAPGVQLINAYGPTETTFASTMHVVAADQDPASPVPIGGPVRQARLHVLDEGLREVPHGEIGRLYIGGIGLARGYLGAPGLTAQRFIPDPWIIGGRLYDTGDLVRYRPDDSLDFLGRIDDQVKRRGYRIGIGEVESAVRADPGVRDAAVVFDGDTNENRRLVACVVGEPAADLAGLRDRLATVLPNYLLPDLIVPVEHLPVTINGKIDRAALTAAIPVTTQPAGGRSVDNGPVNDEEVVLTAIWTDALGLDQAGRHDDFFDLGGHSLLANKIITQVHKRLGVTLNIDAIFDYPTIAGLAGLVRQAQLAGTVTESAE